MTFVLPFYLAKGASILKKKTKRINILTIGKNRAIINLINWGTQQTRGVNKESHRITDSSTFTSFPSSDIARQD
jgi:hypothetical protein